MGVYEGVWETEGYAEAYDPEAERAHGPDGLTTTVYEKNSDREARLLQSELEDYERDTDEGVDSDTWPAAQFQALVDWLEGEGL